VPAFFIVFQKLHERFQGGEPETSEPAIDSSAISSK